MQVSSSDNFHRAQSFAQCEQSQPCDNKEDQDIMRASPLTMGTNGTSSPSMAGSDQSGAGSTVGSNHVDGQASGEDNFKHAISFLLRCPECRFETLSIDRLRSHFPCILRVQPVKFFIFRCDLCKSYSTNRDLMEEHKELHHKQASEVTLTEIPDQMDQGLSNSPLDNRMSGAAQSPFSSQLSCPMCRMICATPREMVAHFENFHGKNNAFPGNRMPFPFLGNQNVFAPPTGITQNQPFVCFLCNLGFNDNESLFQHLITHKDFMLALFSMSNMSKLPLFNNTDEVSNSEMDCPTPLKELPNLTASTPFVPSVSTTSSSVNGNVSVSSPTISTVSPTSNLPCPSRGQLNSNMFLSAVASSTSFPSSTVSNLANLQPLTNQSVAAAAMAASLAAVAPGGDGSRISILPRNQPSPLHNTIRKTKSDMKVINRFLASKGESRDVCVMKVDEVNAHLQDFIKNARKKDNNDYEPESLKAFIHSLERHLKNNGYPHSVLRDNVFSETRQVLQNRLQCLRQSSRTTASVGTSGGGARGLQNAVARQTYADLVNNGTLGHSSPQALINTLFIILKKYFGVKGPGRHRMLTWGQLNVVNVPVHGEVLQFEGGESNGVRQHTRAAGLHFPLDVIETYHVYENLRPVGCRGPSDPFYLMIDPAWERGGPWFQSTALGMSYVQRIPRALTNRLTVPGDVGLLGVGSGPVQARNGANDGPPALAPASGVALDATINAVAARGRSTFDADLPSMVPRLSGVSKDSTASSPGGDEVFEFKLPNIEVGDSANEDAGD